MPNRSFIGLVVLIIFIMIASTPMVLDPLSKQFQYGLDSAGVPGVLPKEPVREKRKDTGTVKNYLELKGYRVGKTDMEDQLPEGRRDVNLSSRTSLGSSRAILPGQARESDPNIPPILVQDGLIIDATGCPVFGADIDPVAVWRDPDLRASYIDRASNSDNPSACSKRLKKDLDNAQTGLWDSVDQRSASRITRNSSLGVSILDSYTRMLDSMFPKSGIDAATILRADVSRELADQAATRRATGARN